MERCGSSRGEPAHCRSSSTSSTSTSESYTNLDEFLGGFDPTDSGSFPSLSVLVVDGTTATLKLNRAIPGRTYRLLRTIDLNTPFVEAITFSVPAAESLKRLQDPTGSATQLFYRIEISKP